MNNNSLKNLLLLYGIFAIIFIFYIYYRKKKIKNLPKKILHINIKDKIIIGSFIFITIIISIIFLINTLNIIFELKKKKIKNKSHKENNYINNIK
jgi:amino acid transporter